jgi:hypothetical protein
MFMCGFRASDADSLGYDCSRRISDSVTLTPAGETAVARLGPTKLQFAKEN